MAEPAGNSVSEIHADKADSQLTERRRLIDMVGVDMAGLPPAIRAAIEALSDEVLSLRKEREALQAALSESELLADRDTLCPVFNRRAFERELSREIALSQRYGTPLSLIYADLDRFKLINDRFGHATGDTVIKHVAQTLLDSVRQTDIVGRLGGDEFAIALTHASLPDCLAKAAALEELVDGLTVRDGQNSHLEPVRLGASFGSVEWQRGMSMAQLIALADETMFRVKAQRRKRG